ncbi:MAG: class I tRNA ligase family protein, partial [Pseudomonadota bacterium]
RIWTMAYNIAGMEDQSATAADAALRQAMHKTIHSVTQNIESFGFNSAIAQIHSFANVLAKSKASAAVQRESARTLAQLMMPMTPHLAEEVWAHLGGEGLVTQAPWPVADPALLIEDTVTLPIQINGKRRGEIDLPRDLPKEEVESRVMATETVQQALHGAAPKKVIVVPGRIVNVVV